MTPTEGGTHHGHPPLPSLVPYPPARGIAGVRGFAVRETTHTGPPKLRLLDRVRHALQARHGSRRTEKAYVAWIRRYIIFHGKRHPADMGAAEVTQFLSSLLISSYGGRSLHEQSHSESFLTLLLHRFGGNGLYILTSPRAALSLTRQLVVLRRIHQLVEENSQFIIATHSPILMAYPRARIFLVDGTGFTEVRYEDTEHYAVTKEFLANRARMLEELLADDEKDA